MPLCQEAKQLTMPESTLCTCACEKMHNDAHLDTNSLWTGKIIAPQIHPYTATDSLCFANSKMISFITF